MGGTRPPLKSEWDLYDLHHRARMTVKPGITGLWQVSGRSEITDFDEVVSLDREYIENKKPKLEVWQQYFENGEYLRAAEITEEQNYNMIDGTMNNRAPKRSVLERLQEKQEKVNHKKYNRNQAHFL